MLRAKFRCSRVQTSPPTGPATREEIYLSAVYGKGNEDWSKYTPAGNLMMVIDNPAAMGKVQVDKEYYIDISLVDEVPFATKTVEQNA